MTDDRIVFIREGRDGFSVSDPKLAHGNTLKLADQAAAASYLYRALTRGDAWRVDWGYPDGSYRTFKAQRKYL